MQCFRLCFLEVKEKILSLLGRNLKRKERRQKADLTHKIETYFDWISFSDLGIIVLYLIFWMPSYRWTKIFKISCNLYFSQYWLWVSVILMFTILTLSKCNFDVHNTDMQQDAAKAQFCITFDTKNLSLYQDEFPLCWSPRPPLDEVDEDVDGAIDCSQQVGAVGHVLYIQISVYRWPILSIVSQGRRKQIKER